MPDSTFLEIVVSPLSARYCYRQGQQTAKVGYCVDVPLGKRSARGYVIAELQQPPAECVGKELKQVEATPWEYAHFSESQLKFFQWVADYYGEPLANVIECALPKPAVRRDDTLIVPKALGSAQQTATKATAAGSPDESLLEVELDQYKLRAKQRELFKQLAKHPDGILLSVLKQQFSLSKAQLTGLAARELVTLQNLELRENPPLPDKAAWASSAVELNLHQQRAASAVIEAIQESRFQPFLLHGVTGSGKTEVYLEAIKAARLRGKSALVIVPEIALTPQLLDRFRARLGDELAIVHSALGERLRWEYWRRMLEGRCMIALGARSAIFAPLENLGVIIVDEEHESSFKQAEGLRYHARDLAIVRARLADCPVVLGSATPSLESYSHAQGQHYRYLSIPTRNQDTKMPQCELVDLNTIKPWEMPSPHVSPRLFELLQETLLSNGQAFILYNRRGFSAYLQCERCSQTLSCPNCSVTLTYHKHTHTLVCHYCNYQLAPPRTCAACAEGATKPAPLVQRGAGTERIFEELQALLPGVPMARLDRDTAKDLASYREILDRMRSGELRVLVGTQMIAKGHDLPDVTLVGIADCDVGLHMPDFRAGERSFQLLTQAAGRAGRAQREGRVLFQSRLPKHRAIQAALRQDFEGFAKQELQARQGLWYPPFARLLRIVASAQIKEQPGILLNDYKQRLQGLLLQHAPALQLLGPAVCPLERVSGLWRAQLLLKSSSPAILVRIIHLLRAGKKERNIRVVFDIDPQDMM
jgi:primosomal protein N' (replication factor Y)